MRRRLRPDFGAHLIYWSVRAASALVAVLPVQLSYMVAGVMGELYCILRPSHSRWAAYNYARVLHEREDSPVVRRMARKSFANYARVLVDFFRLPHLTAEAVCGAASILGAEHLAHAAVAGKGIIIVTAHFGSWDRAAVVFAGLGYRPAALVDTFQPPQLNAWVTRTREKFGMKAIAVEKPGVLREMYRALARGEAVVFLVDRPDPDGVPVTFFGERTGFPAGAAQVALRSGVPVIAGGLFRQPGNRTYTGFAELISPPPPSGDRGTDVQRLTQVIAARLEREIVAHPAQWYMFRPMWPVEQETDGRRP